MLCNTGSTSQKKRKKGRASGRDRNLCRFHQTTSGTANLCELVDFRYIGNIPDDIFQAKSFADPLFSLVATATRASSLPIPGSLLDGWLLLKKSVPGLGLLWYPSDCDAYSSISDLAVIDSSGNGCVLFETYRMRMGYDAVRCTRCCAQWQGGTQEMPLMGYELLHCCLNPPGMFE